MDRWRQRYDYLVFDVTGTLLVPDPKPANVYQAAAARHGITVRLAAMQQRIGEAIRREFSRGRTDDQPLRREATDEARERGRWERIVAACLPELSPPQQREAFESLWDDYASSSHWRWRQGSQQLIQQLQQRGFSLAIATNFDLRAHAVLDGFPELRGIDQRFPSSEVGFSKPDRRFFDAIARRLQTPPDRLLMIGDDPHNDIEGSQHAGWDAESIEDLVASP